MPNLFLFIPDAGGGATTINCTVGNAVADGVTASLNRTIAASVGNAVADGLTASLNRTIVCGIGNAVADGVTANIQSGNNIACSVGNAVADGLTAQIIAPTTITCLVGNAVANGLTATITNGSGAYLTWADEPTIINDVFADPRMLAIIASLKGNNVRGGVN